MNPCPNNANSKKRAVIAALTLTCGYFWVSLQPASAQMPMVANSAPITISPAPDSPVFDTARKLKDNPALVRGYEQFMAGNLATAHREYEALLLLDPRNSDALHGMAAISLRQGKPALAEKYFISALESNPKDAMAQAGLIGLKGQSDHVSSQSLLQTLIVAQPDQAIVHFALGNLYASLSLWSDARQSYVNALQTEPDNPDILFNLAVSLDRLHQPRLALAYYLRAWALSDAHPYGFDRAQIAARLHELR